MLKSPILRTRKNGVAAVALTSLAALWAHSAAEASTTAPICGLPKGVTDTGPTGIRCSVDSSGCATAQGYEVTNYCNSSARTDGTSVWLRHDPTSYYFGGTSGATAYVSLYCTNSATSAVFKGMVQAPQRVNCPDTGDYIIPYAIRSHCGASDACGNK